MQEVNLLNSELIPRNDPFTLREFGLALAVLTTLLVLLSCWKLLSIWSTNQAIAEHKHELKKLQQDNRTLQITAHRKPDAALVQQLDTQKNHREEQRHLVAVLEQEPINHGFHDHLSDLATIDMRSLWFDSISLQHGGLNIELAGFSESAEQIPVYLSLLSDGAAFSGYSFDGLEIKRESDALVSFRVHGPQEEATL